MNTLPVVTASEAVRRFEQLGYVVTRQKGSHIRLRHPLDHRRRPITIPMHAGRALKPGLLRCLIRTASITVEEFTNLS